MAQLAFASGGATGVPGAAGIAFLGGSLLYSFLNPPDDIVQEGPRLNRQLTTTSAYGIMRPIKYGTIPINGNIIDGSELYEKRNETKSDSGGKGGLAGGGQDVITVTYTYSIDLAVALGEPIDDVIQIYANEKLIYDVSPNAKRVSPEWLNLAIYKGTEDQLPDPTLQVLHGVDTPAYRGESYVVFTRFQLADFNNQIPNFRFIVVSKGTPLVSEDQKVFTNGGSIGALLYDRNSSLIYYANNGQTDERIGFIYDTNSEQTVISLRWPDNTAQFDEGGGAALFSINTFVDGVEVPLGPNASLAIQVEKPGNDPALALYNSKSGAFLATVDVPIDPSANTKILTPDERSGTLFKVHADAPAFFYFLQSLTITSNDGSIVLIDNGAVQIPVPDRDGIREWAWREQPSYPEGTTRNGTIGIVGVDGPDAPTTNNYFCIVEGGNLFVTAYSIMTEYTFDDITAIVWDSVQEYFWVMGQSDTVAKTRIKAYDLSANEVPGASYEWDNTLYTLAEQYVTYDAATFSIWLYAAGTLYQWHTINRDFESITTGFSAGNPGTGDSLIYVNSTRTAWRKKELGLIDLYRLGRISETGTGLDVVVADLCNRAGLSSGQYDVSELSTVIVDGYKIESDGNIREKIVPLQQAYLFDGIDKADLIEWKFRGQDTAETIPENDLGAVDGTQAGDEYITIDRIMDLDLPKKTEITYYNKKAEYEQNTQMARRTASYLEENSKRITLPIVLDDALAAKLADVVVHMPYIEREVYDLRALPKWQFLVCGDVIDIEYQNRIFNARIVSKDFEDGIVSFRCTREDKSVLTSYLSGGSATPRVIEIKFNPLTNSVHLDIPLLRERDNNAGYYLSACGMDEEWTGGNIYKSLDGNTFNIVTTVLTPSVIGTSDQALGVPVNATYWDRTSKIKVYMRCGIIESVTEEQALKGENLYAIGVNGRFELVNIVNATLIEADVYECDTFIRGRLGTEWAITTHQLGDFVCKLSTDDLTYINDSLANLNQRFLYRAVSLGGSVYSDKVIDQFHTNTGVCLKPYAVSNLQATKNPSTLDILFTWEPRSRFPWRDFWSGVQSDPNNFELIIPLFNTSNTRTETITNDTQFNYTRAAQLSDGYPASDLTIENFDVYHISDTVGRGYVATLQTGVGPEPHPMLVYGQTIGATTIWECSDDVASPTIADIYNNYPLDHNVDCILGQPAILPGSIKTCIENDGFGSAFSNAISSPPGLVDVTNFSLLIIFRPLEPAIIDNQPLTLIYLDLGGVEYDIAGFRRKSDGTLYALHNNGFAESVTIPYPVIPVGTTVQLIITYESTGIGDFGPFKFFANGQLVGEESVRSAPLEDTEDQKFVTGYSPETSFNVQVNQFRESHIMVFDHALTDQEITNLFVASGI